LGIRVDPSSSKEETEGSHHLTVFNQISNHYQYLYTRKSPDKLNDASNQFGYYMDEAGKSVLISELKSAWRQRPLGYVEHNSETIEQAAFLEVKDGLMKAMEGEDESSLMASAGALWLASDFMPAPYYIVESRPRRKGYAQDAQF
jgi:hypothetical protein